MQADATEAIYNAGMIDPFLDADEIIVDLAHFKSQETPFNKKFFWSENVINKMTAKTWWTGVAPATHLLKLAAMIVALPPTSASVEQFFSFHT